MATTKETMKVIAGGVNKKEEPEVIMDGTETTRPGSVDTV